jgi:hypothetical protein
MVRFARTFFVIPCSDSMAVIDHSRFTIPSLLPHVCELCDLRVMPEAQITFTPIHLNKVSPKLASYARAPHPISTIPAQPSPSPSPVKPYHDACRGGGFHHSAEEPRTWGEWEINEQ